MAPFKPFSMRGLAAKRRTLLQSAAVGALGTALPGSAMASEPTPSAPALYRSGSLRRVLGVAVEAQAPFAVRVLSKIGFGPRPGDIERFNALGASDAERLERYVDRQLDVTSIDDSALAARLSTAGFTTLEKTRARLWAEHAKRFDDWETRMLPLFESERAAYVRAAFSERQLFEVLVDFWHNHFNVHGYHFDVGPMFVHYDRDVIRRHALGNFRAFLEAVTISPSMMAYLDQISSRAQGPNENYAREFLELYTLGARHSAGFTPSDAVPAYDDGLKLAYTEADVKAFARALSGWTIANGWEWPTHPDDHDDGAFLFRDDWHDWDAKTVLGLAIEPTGVDEARTVIDALARHPKVAEYVCEKLCRRLVSDEPPDALVAAAAGVFIEQADADDQLAQVVRVIVLSEAFRTDWGRKIKRPFETLVSALRAYDVDFSLEAGDRPAEGEAQWFWFYNDNFYWGAKQTGHFPFNWAPPNGYPDHKEDWGGSTPLVMTWRLLNEAVNHWGIGDRHRFDVLGPTLAALPDPADHTAEKLTDFWLTRAHGYVPTGSRAALVAFMAQDGPSDTPLGDIRLDEWRDSNSEAYLGSRLRMLAALALMTPEFLLR